MKLNNKNMRGQAAVEFLMTYGWMLLIVLIVGALVFSFVDFGGLLPDSLNIDKGFRADAPQMVVSSGDNSITLVLDYVGTSGIVKVDTKNVKFESDAGGECGGNLNRILGNRLDNHTFTRTFDGRNASSNALLATNATIANSTELTVHRGDSLVVTIYCSSNATGGVDLVSGSSLEGDVTIRYQDARSGVPQTATGVLRAQIN